MDRLVREWPLALGLAVLVIGHIWYYYIHGADWHISGPPLLAAVAVLVAAELVRAFLNRNTPSN